jgi:hypothetical protein
MGALFHNVQCKGEEHNQGLINGGEPNRFPSIPRIMDETWQTVMNCHPKTLVCTLAIRVKEGVQLKLSDMFDSVSLATFRTVTINLRKPQSANC